MRATFAAFLLLCAVLGLAYPPFWQTLKETYPPVAGSKVAAAKCAVCHVKPGGGARNGFGVQVQTALAKSGANEVTAAVLLSVEGLDPDRDGRKSGDELKAGTLPATPDKGRAAPAARATAEAASGSEGLVPSHSFHPAVVHFPVALFAFAAFLTLFSARNQRYEDAAKICAAGGAASLLVTLPTGLAAMLRMGYNPLNGGQIAVHIVLAVLTSVAGLVAWRSKGVRARGWILLAGALALLAGHFGGNLSGV